MKVIIQKAIYYHHPQGGKEGKVPILDGEEPKLPKIWNKYNMHNARGWKWLLRKGGGFEDMKYVRKTFNLEQS